MVTASHNPPDYNGMKFVREESRPISGDTGLQGHPSAGRGRAICRAGGATGQRVTSSTSRRRYVEHLLSLRRPREAASR